MPICGCTSPCNCNISEDGFFANRILDGRRNTVVDGSGTPEDPYTISFVQSEFWRPPTGELAVASTPIDNIASPGSVALDPPNYVVSEVYEDGNLFLTFPVSLGTELTVIRDTFHIIGASATFSANATGGRWLSIGAVLPSGATGNAIASDSQSGLAASPTICSCAGFAKGLFNFDNVSAIIANPRIDTIWLTVSQNSGVTLTVSDIKVWITSI